MNARILLDSLFEGGFLVEAYTDINFKTKKQLKDALAAGRKITVYQPNDDLFGGHGLPRDGRVTLEGPHSPEPHRWYATALLKDGYVVAIDPPEPKRQNDFGRWPTQYWR